MLFDSPARVVLIGVIAASLELSVEVSLAEDVRDGDTIEIQGQLACLYGIDAFELGQTCTDARGRTWRCGVAAKATLATLIRGQVLECLVIEEDPNGCYQSRCMREDGADLGAYMCARGWPSRSPTRTWQKRRMQCDAALALGMAGSAALAMALSCALRQMPLRNGQCGAIRVPAQGRHSMQKIACRGCGAHHRCEEHEARAGRTARE